MKKIKETLRKLKDGIVLVDKKILVIAVAAIVIVILVLFLLLFNTKTLKCEQKVDIEGVTNVNTIEISYRGDEIKEVKTIFDYEIDRNEDTKYFKLVKTTMANLSKVYEKVNGVEFKTTKDKDNKFQAVQIVNFDEISNSDLAKIGIVRGYKKAKENYEAAGYTCK